jgi:MerR family redox-sensitive transcriptional activator SoxR
MPVLPDRITIGALSVRSGVPTSALRFYESLGLIASERSSGNHRLFARNTLRRVSFIRAAQQVGLSLEEIGTALASLPSERTPTKADWERLSRVWRRRLDEQIASLERLRDELTGCIECGCLSLRSCRLFNPEDTAAADGPGARRLVRPAATPRPGPRSAARRRPPAPR